MPFATPSPQWRPSLAGTSNAYAPRWATADYNMLQKYVHLATERDLGRMADWEAFILTPEAMAQGLAWRG